MRKLLLALAVAGIASPALAADVTVAVTSIVEHPALNAARDGVKKALADAGYKEGENLVFQFETAQGNPATAAQIAQKYVGENPNVIVPIATPSAQAVVAATQDIPVVFMTGDAGQAEELVEGARPYLLKPFAIATLIDVVENAARPLRL